MTRSGPPLILCFVIGTVIACIERAPEPPAMTFLPAPEVSPPLPPAPSFEELEAYTPIGKRDPFRAPHIGDLPDEPLEALQRFELGTLRLIAVVTGPAAPYAMIEDPNGIGHTVRRGALIGKNWGRIKAISARKVDIEEVVYDIAGRKVKHITTLEIPKMPRPVSL